MSAANPIDFPEIWHSIVVGGESSPGVVKVSGAGRPYEWDKKKPKGKQGATTTYTGEDLPEFDVTLTLWTSDQHKAWDKFRPLFKYDPTKKNLKAIDIYYPSLADLGIKSVVCKFIGAVEPEEGGKSSVKIKLMEYAPPKKGNATKTPANSTANAGKTKGGEKPPTAPDARDQQIARLLAEARSP